jgi:SdpC family antimicrobial peptide
MIISKIRTVLIKYQIGSLLAVMFLFFSCTKDKTIADLTKSQTNHELKTLARNASFTDKDVFKGVVFLEGPVADKLDDFKDYNFRAFVNDETQIQKVLLFQQAVINYLETTDANYFQKFRANIGSNDYDVVKATFLQAGNDIYEASIVLTHESRTNVDNMIASIASNFTSQYNLSNSSSTQDVKDFAKLKGSETLYYDTHTAVYVVAVLVAVVAAFFTFGLVCCAITQHGDGPNHYMSERFLTKLTLNLSGI